ncbi:MAG: NTP transferase domain-containing protein [Opitutus sp.]|nr:NTP transferase domain-containing protein [Opitutus sp.]
MFDAPNSFSGAVLAGGESRRMGSDKALLTVNGEALWQRQSRVLHSAGADPVVVVRRRTQPPLPGARAGVFDRFENAGPLAGLEAALEAARSDLVAVLAVDMPAIEAGWFSFLLRHCSRGQGAVARSLHGVEPLAAIYPRGALFWARGQIEAERFALQEFVRVLENQTLVRVVDLPSAFRKQAENWNEPGRSIL